MLVGDIRKLLRKRFRPPGWAFFEEVHDTMGERTRQADGIAMSLWPSRGIELHGVEIKVSRADWLIELKRPEKAETFARYCEHWWVVTTEDVVDGHELPPSWGLLIARGGKLVEKKKSVERTPLPMPRDFLAAILRRAHQQFKGMVRSEEIDSKLMKEFERGKQLGYANAERELRADRIEDLRQSVATFEAKSGLHINAYNGEKLGEAVEVVLRTDGFKEHRAHLEMIERQAQRHLEEVKQMLQQTEAFASKQNRFASFCLPVSVKQNEKPQVGTATQHAPSAMGDKP